MKIKFLNHAIKKVRTYWNLKDSGLFDKEWYIKTYPEYRRSFLPPYWYYIFKGYKKGHNPSVLFNSKLYWLMHPDHNRNKCALVHFAMYGEYSQLPYYHSSILENANILDSDLNAVKSVPNGVKKILLISHESSLTGAPRALLNLAEKLKEMGAYVVFWTMKDGPLKHEILKYGIEYKYPSLSFSNYPEDEVYKQKTLDYIANFNTVLLNTIVAIPYIDTLEDVNVQKICWVHDGAFSFDCWIESSRFPDLINKFDKALVVGDYAKRIAESYCNGNATLQNFLYGIENNTDNDTIKPYWPIEADEEKVKILFAGSIEKRKGHDALVNSLKLLPSHFLQQLSIVIVGGCLEKPIEERLQNCSNGCVHILGLKKHDILLSYMKGMDVLLCPSLDDPMPIVCTEAMMFSKPVIVGSATGTASYIENGKNGYIVESGSAQSLADALTEIVVHRDNIAAIGQNSKSIYESNFTMEHFRDNVRRIFLKNSY